MPKKEHALLGVYTTTIKAAGAKIAVGECRCGWRYETTYAWEVRSAYRKHLGTERVAELLREERDKHERKQ